MTVFSGCGQVAKPDNDKIKVVCTIFPQYDWVGQIIGDQTGSIEVKLLLSNQADLHNYQPTVDDIITISDCDLFIYTGGQSDQWVEDALSEATNSEMVVINLLEELGNDAKIEEWTEGMEEEEHDHTSELTSDLVIATGDHEEGETEEGNEYDEHVWLSLRNAQKLCTVITEALTALDPDNATLYESNRISYQEKLSALDDEYEQAVAGAVNKTLVFGDRFPFRYLLDDYDLDYFAAFSGCSAETEASFETIAFLAQKADELGVDTLMITESGDRSIAETISASTVAGGHRIVELDAIQSVTSDDIVAGITYLSIMQSNLQVLKDVIN
jgi:zinc transport system substrate-binding protein